MKLVYTVCTISHLAHARVLGKSLRQTNPDYHFVIGLVDRVADRIRAVDWQPFDLVEVETLAISEFEAMRRRYNIVELCCALKPHFALYLLACHPHTTTLLYLDSDIVIYNRLSPVEAALSGADLVLTPHISHPYMQAGLPDETNFLNAGLYNAGFVGLRPSASARAMLIWWQQRLLTQGYMNYGRGMSCDQLWLNYVPLFFENVRVLTHPGCNLAYWNLPESPLSRTDDGRFVVKNTEPLVFFHFSGYHPDRPGKLSTYQTRISSTDAPCLRQLTDSYRDALREQGFDRFCPVPNGLVRQPPAWVLFLRGWAIVLCSMTLEWLRK